MFAKLLTELFSMVAKTKYVSKFGKWLINIDINNVFLSI